MNRCPTSTCPCCSRRWSSTAATPGRVRRRRTARDDFPVVVIGCGESGLLAGIRLKEAGIPFTIVEKNAGVGGTWYQNTYPGARVDVRQPLLLLQLRADRSVDTLLRRTARTAGVFPARDGQARHRPPRAVGDRGHRGVLGRRRPPRGPFAPATAAEQRQNCTARAVISAVGQLDRPHTPTIDGQHDFAGTDIPLQRSGTTQSTYTASGSP